MRNELVEKRNPESCTDCAAARLRPSGYYYANCDGCVARAIAGSPLAPAGLADPATADLARVEQLKALVQSSFPPGRRRWAAAAVREWFGILSARRAA